MHRTLLLLPLTLISGLEAGYLEPAPPTPAPVAVAADNAAPLPTPADMERLAKTDALAVLEACLTRYDREVKGYSATFEKHDIGGKTKKKEVAAIHFRDKPHSVHLTWNEGMGRAEAVLFVEGENSNQMLVRPSGRLLRRFIVSRAVDGEPAESGLFTLQQFGFKRTTERTVKEWRQLREKGALSVTFLGVKPLKQAGDRPCWTWLQVVKTPGADRIKDVIVSVDTATWLQVGTELKDTKGDLLGSYYFRDVKLNPQFKKTQFQRAALNP